MSQDDYEQSERVQEWLRHNWLPIVVGIVIGLALIFGYRQWTKHKANENIEAANQYRLVENAWAGGQVKQAGTLTDSLINNHAGSAYAVLAATLRARHELSAGKADKAVQSLTWASQHAADGPLKSLTQLRLARAELDAGHAKQALATLAQVPAGAYAGMVADLRGDVQAKLGDQQAAIKAWRAALAAFKPAAPQRNIVQMKIDNFAPQTALASKPPAAKPATAGTSGKPAKAGKAVATSSSSEKPDA